MLAEKYDYAWDEARKLQEVEEPVRKTRKVRRPDQRKIFRKEMCAIFGIVALIYFANVIRSESLVLQGNTLVNLQKQEAELITQNSELKIEVEQLKGPERVIGLAEQRLGMRVARSNIYLKAAQK